MERILVLGSLNMDLVVAADRLPRAGETIAGGDLTLFEGGKGANQANAAARLGGKVTMIGQVGGDLFAVRLRESLSAAGADISGIGSSPSPTGTACITVLPNGENAILISPGANATVSTVFALERMKLASPYGFLLAQLETPIETTVAAFAEARRSGATTILDPAPVQPIPPELIPNIDFVTPNQVEAAALLGSAQPPQSIAEARDAAEALLRAGYRGVILKLGSLGCFLATAEVTGAVPAFEVAAVDTTAAGDTFNAAFAVALSEGMPLLDAARFANAAAALSVTRRGAQNSAPNRGEVESMMASGRMVECSL